MGYLQFASEGEAGDAFHKYQDKELAPVVEIKCARNFDGSKVKYKRQPPDLPNEYEEARWLTSCARSREAHRPE